MKSHEIDLMIYKFQSNPAVRETESVEKLKVIFSELTALKEMGDDNLRSVWLTAETRSGKKLKWYNFACTKYKEEYYFFLESKLIFSITDDKVDYYRCMKPDLKFLDWITEQVRSTVSRVLENAAEYNRYIDENLPHEKRLGKILRSDYWKVAPDLQKYYLSIVTKKDIGIMRKVQTASVWDRSKLKINKMTAGDFFRYCELGYDANKYFEEKQNVLSAKEKYARMADRRDCGLKKIDERSEQAFIEWYEKESNCGGHPWEVSGGGNSTHISLFVHKKDDGWILRLTGCSINRVAETVKFAVALYSAGIPFYLEKAEEIVRMITGEDYIGIVPNSIFPRYCHSMFPKEDKIIDFMNLPYEKRKTIIKKSYWYPIEQIDIIKVKEKISISGSSKII